MRLARITLSVLAVLAAPLLAVQGFANARQAMAPLSWNGFWQASLARQLVQIRAVDGVPGIVVPDEAIQIARDAFATEPLASDAIFVLATRDETEELVRFGLALDKRNRYLGMLEIQSQLLDRDFASALTTIDRLSSTHPQLLGMFLRPFTQSLSQPGAEEMLYEALQSEPVWAEHFWRMIPADQDSVRRMYALRQRTHVGTTDDSDLLLAAALARAGLFDEASQFWATIASAQNNPTAFLPASEVEPFGWRVNRGGNRGFSARGEGRYEIFMARRSSSEMARQLVLLEPGTYRFSATITPENAAEHIEVSLACASDEGEAREAQNLSEAVTWAIAEGCQAYWLVLSANAWDRRADLEATLEEMRLRKAS